MKEIYKPTVSKESLERAIEQLADPTCEDSVIEYIVKIQTELDNKIKDVITQSFHELANEAHLDIRVNPEKVIEMLKKHKKRTADWNFTSIAECYTCPKCHAVIDKDDAYCFHCGQALEW